MRKNKAFSSRQEQDLQDKPMVSYAAPSIPFGQWVIADWKVFAIE